MKTLFRSIGCTFLLLPLTARAEVKLENPLAKSGVNTIGDLLNKIINYLTVISAPIITIVVLIGAFKMLTAMGNENKFKEGKMTVTYAAIGAAVVLIAQGVSLIISKFVGQ